MHHTTDKGDIGVAAVSADLIKRGLDVLQPLSASLPFDLVVHKKGKFYKVQVKYREEKNGRIQFQMTRAVIGGGKVRKRRLLSSEADLFAVYCPDTDECYYLGKEVVAGVTDVVLRILPSKNGQKKGVRMARNYLIPRFP